MKPWYASKTIWTNVVAGAAALATIAGVDVLADPAVQGKIVTAVTIVANLVLRFVTREPIG